MKEFYTHINKKIYYFTVIIVIAIMIIGLVMGNPRFGKFEIGYIFHVGLVVILSACLLLYLKFVTHAFRLIIITIASVYFYALFFLYPDTWSTFIFLCFIPAIAILFFDLKLFYFSLLLNSVSIIFTFSYILLIDQGYPYIKQDLMGNVINFIGSQVIIYFIFYLTQGRIKKQQLYYEQIQQSERLKTTGQLAAAVAHEIRNPLTVVKGFLQLYQKDAGFSDDVKGNFTLMIDELNIAEQVITQFLTIAKPNNEIEIETVDLKLFFRV